MLSIIKRIWVLLLFLTPFLLNAQKAVYDAQYRDPYLDGIVEIRIRNEYRGFCAPSSIAIADVNAIFGNSGIHSLTQRFPNASVPRTQFNRAGERYADLSLFYTARFPAGTYLPRLISVLKKCNSIEIAEPRFLPATSIIPSDDSIPEQYSLAKINAFAGWDIHRGDASTTIGITDTGFNPAHPDLGGNVKYNFADPINGADDDADGFIDNYMGWDTGENDNDPSVSPGNTHGQHVAGLASAVVDNARGIAGTGYNSSFMFIKIANAAGLLSGAYEGVVYAAEHGCRIINCSWGGFQFSELNQEIFRYVSINKDCLVLCGAGNNRDERLFYPASYEYAFSVGSSDAQDRKADFSSYGYLIDLVAPGDQILSTWSENEYIISGGTSMSAPITAGCATILSAAFPTYTSQQIAEQLKVTTDVIDEIPANQEWKGKLGSGRLNLFRALTETGKPSIVLNQIASTDNQEDLYLPGDTIRLTGMLTNYLFPAQQVLLEVASLSEFLEPLNPVRNIGPLGTLSTVPIEAVPLLFRISETAPFNQQCVVKLTFTSDGFLQHQFIYLTINADFINVQNNNIHTSIGSNGLIGLTGNGISKGLGFSFGTNQDLLYEGGLMVGILADHVLDNIRGNQGVDRDWFTSEQLIRVQPLTGSTEHYQGRMRSNIPEFSLSTTQRVLSDSSALNRNFVIVEYTLKNETFTPLNDVYAGIFTDWDLANAGSNNAGFSAALKTGYVFTVPEDTLYTGIRVLGSNPAIFNAIDNVSGGAGGLNLTDGFQEFEKYIALSTPRLTTTAGASGTDVVTVTSTGPFQLLPDSTHRVAFALLAGKNRPQLEAAAQNAAVYYQTVALPLAVKEAEEIPEILFIPNPANEFVRIETRNAGAFELFLTDISGRILLSQKVTGNASVLNTSELPTGIYFVTFTSGKAHFTKRLSIIH